MQQVRKQKLSGANAICKECEFILQRDQMSQEAATLCSAIRAPFLVKMLADSKHETFLRLNFTLGSNSAEIVQRLFEKHLSKEDMTAIQEMELEEKNKGVGSDERDVEGNLEGEGLGESGNVGNVEGEEMGDVDGEDVEWEEIGEDVGGGNVEWEEKDGGSECVENVEEIEASKLHAYKKMQKFQEKLRRMYVEEKKKNEGERKDNNGKEKRKIVGVEKDKGREAEENQETEKRM